MRLGPAYESNDRRTYSRRKQFDCGRPADAHTPYAGSDRSRVESDRELICHSEQLAKFPRGNPVLVEGNISNVGSLDTVRNDCASTLYAYPETTSKIREKPTQFARIELLSEREISTYFLKCHMLQAFIPMHEFK